MDKQRRELFVTRALEQDRTTLGRHNFKNQFKQFFLQLVEIGDRMNQTADLVQGMNVIEYPGSCQETFAHIVGRKTKYIPGQNLCARSGDGVVRKGRPHFCDVELLRFLRLIFIQKYKNRFAH